MVHKTNTKTTNIQNTNIKNTPEYRNYKNGHNYK